MIMKEKMSQLREAAVHFLQVLKGASSTRAPCFVCRTKTTISAVPTLLMRPKIRVSTPVALEGLKGHELGSVLAAFCLQLFDHVDL